MTRLSLCALAVALAAGQSLAEPMGQPMQRFREMGATQGEEQTETYTMEDTTTPKTTSYAGSPQQLLSQLPKLLEKQLQLQDTLMNKIMKDVDEYLKETTAAFHWGETQSTAVNKVNEMMEMISNRMNTAIDGANELMANSETLDTETLRRATSKFMKEVRVQDVVIDALWASLRGVQTSAWMTTTAGVEQKDTTTVANRSAEEFITRMYHNLRAAGISEEDIVKFVPKMEVETMQARNMGKKGRGYGYAYGYPVYGWSYPSYGYGWGYPSYGYGWGYPSYGYGWGYPYYSHGWGYPYSRHYWRRLRPTSCPDCPPTPATNMMSPLTTPFRSMGEETMMGTTPMTPQGYSTMNQGYSAMMGQGYPNPMMEGMNYPMDTMASGMNTAGTMGTPYNTMMPLTYTGSYRSLFPTPETLGVAPEPMLAGMPY